MTATEHGVFAAPSYATDAGHVIVVRDGAWATERLPLPVLEEKPVSPANAAPTAPLEMPALNPLRLTPLSDATPAESVAADPTAVPPSVKLIVFPDSGVGPVFSVAVSVAVPAYVPEPATAEMAVACWV